MQSSILCGAVALSDRDLLARLDALADQEREATVQLVAHLAALDDRPALYAAQGYGSLFSYCTQALRLSEDAACNRIEAARTCRRFPGILERLASGSLSLTSLRLLGRHLTAENHEAVLARAKGRSRREIEMLVAELAPRPDVPASVRKLPALHEAGSSATTAIFQDGGSAETDSAPIPAPPPFLGPRPTIQASAPERYRVQFTIDSATHEKLLRLQALLRREIPTGDPGLIFGRAVDVLLASVEKDKLGASARPRPGRPIRPGTDSPVRSRRSRHVPSEVKREVWQRDAGKCAFVAPSGRRCDERTFLEYHHVQPHSLEGRATVGNISLRCRRHNQYEAELWFGPRGSSSPREVRALRLPRDA
jgi:hypothetical protein